MTLHTGFAARLCFWFSANDSSIEHVCPPVVYTICKKALLPTNRIFATNSSPQGPQMRSTTKPFAQ